MKKIGIGITGSFCNLINALDIYEELAKEYEITFFVSYTVQKEINRFIEYSYYKERLQKKFFIKNIMYSFLKNMCMICFMQ